MSFPVGFMQGRLCDPVKDRVQAFPWRDWDKEFSIASAIGIRLMEWTLDQDRLFDNPLMTADGRCRILNLCKSHAIRIPSVTGDCFMQSPFWKTVGGERKALESDFVSVVHSCVELGVELLVVPLVDNGRLENEQQKEYLLDFLGSKIELLRELGLRILFESDFSPGELATFISSLPSDAFGVNYDMGNSAALGFKPEEEFAAYGSRILNVHVKDRVLGGGTVSLGAGNTDFPTVFRLLRKAAYPGNLIMQTARAADNDHAGALRQYMDQIEAWVKES